jgi:hypothetical protein
LFYGPKSAVKLSVEAETMTQKRSMQLSAALCDAAERRFGSAFASIERLLESVLTELLRDDALTLHQAETQLVEQRLRDLGYL